MDINDIITITIAMFSLIVSASSAIYSKKTRQEFGAIEAIQNIHPILSELYTNREISPKFIFEGESYCKLRELRNKISTKYNMKSSSFLTELTKFHTKSLEIGTLENKFAYEAAIAVNQIGLMLLTGTIPLEIIISFNGSQFLEDWLFSYPLAKKIRNESTLIKKNKDGSWLGYNRIHGEWLANFTWVYFNKQWKSSLLNSYKTYFLEEGINPKKQESMIREMETQIIPKYVSRKIKKLL